MMWATSGGWGTFKTMRMAQTIGVVVSSPTGSTVLELEGRVGDGQLPDPNVRTVDVDGPFVLYLPTLDSVSPLAPWNNRRWRTLWWLGDKKVNYLTVFRLLINHHSILELGSSLRNLDDKYPFTPWQHDDILQQERCSVFKHEEMITHKKLL
jgi:hypothetical protein